MIITVFTLLQGIVIGLLISIPLGPIGLLTVKRTVIHGVRAGIIAGLAVVLVDGLVASIFLLGFHEPFRSVRAVPFMVSLIGGILIFFYGLKIFNDDTPNEVKEPKDWHHHFLGTLSILATNPTTYISFGSTAILLTRFITRPLETRMLVAIGFFLGAFIWWTTLVILAHKNRNHYLKNSIIRKIMGIIIMVLAFITIYTQLFPATGPKPPMQPNWQDRLEDKIAKRI